MIPFKPSSEKTLAHQLLTYVKLTSVLKEEKKKLQNLKDTRPRVRQDYIKWQELHTAIHHESDIARTEQRITKLYHKTEEYEKEIIQYIPDYLYNKTIEISLYGDDHNHTRYSFLLKVISGNEVVVKVKKEQDS